MHFMQASTERQKQASRRSQLRRAKTGFWLTSWLRWASMKAGYILSDHTRNALILAVFAFKVNALQAASHSVHILRIKSMAFAPCLLEVCFHKVEAEAIRKDLFDAQQVLQCYLLFRHLLD